MANTLTDLKDVRIAQAALMPWMTELMPLSIFSTNFGPASADKGDTVKVPVVGAPSPSSDFDGNYVKNIDSEASTIPVVLNKHKFKTVHMTAKEAATTAVPLLEKLVSTAAQQLAIDVLTDIFSAIKKNQFATATDVASAEDFSYKTVLKIREACNKAKMPKAGRSLVLNTSLNTALLADDIVSRSFITNLAQPGVVEARINRLAGLNVYETDCVPDNGENLAGFVTHPSAMAIAMRYLQPIANYDEAGAVTDPVTGLTFGYLRYTDTTSNKVYITLECLYGYQVIRPAALQRITVTPAT
ncbi:MAG: hypothetical protein IIV41_11460 [Akkermansia sp.]|nr:hypothetical protein [Akkermansia sp.]